MPLTANFIADFSSFIKACADATASTAEVEAAGDKLASSFTQSVQTAAGSLQSVGSGIADFGKKAWSLLDSSQMREFGHAVTEFATEYVGEFSKAEQATARLNTALVNSGQTSPTIAKAYADMAKELQNISTYSHIAVEDAMSIFTTIGQVGPDNMRKTLEAAMNLAAFMRIDLPDAAKLMQKAAESNGEALGKLKVVLGDSYVKGMDFAQIVDAIAKKFSGQFNADLNTTAGSMKNFSNQVADANEELGKMQAESLRGLLDTFHQLPESVQNFSIKAYQLLNAVGPLVGAIGGVAQVAGTLFPEAMIAAGATILEFLAGAGAALLSWPVLIIAGIVALAIGIYKYWDEIKAYLKRAVDAIKGWMDDLAATIGVPVLAAVEKLYNGIKTWLYDKLTALLSQTSARLKSDIQEIATAFDWLYTHLVGGSVVPDTVNGIADQFGRLKSVMVAPALAANQSVARSFDELWTSAASVMEFINPLMFAGISMPNQGVKFANVFSSTSGLTATPPGVQISLNMTGMLGTDDPQTRQIMSDLVSNAVMQGMRGGRLLGTA